MTRVAVAVATFRRPADLAALLPLLVAETETVRRARPDAEVGIVVVDNDAGGSAADVVTAYPAIRYVTEPVPGIAAARNRALAAAGDADLLAFIDDDERPDAGWLGQLLDTWARTGAAAVAGAVRTELPGNPDPWVVQGQFFTRQHRATLPTGTLLPSAATNNLLLDLAPVRRAGLRFDPAFGISGGEDELFTRRLVAAGGQIAWCAEAVVHEEVRPDRLNRRFLLLRAFSYGTIDSRIAQALAGSLRARTAARARCVGKGLPRIGYGLIRWAYGRVTRSLWHDAYGAQLFMRGLGLVAGSLGLTFDRYRRAGNR
jgi:glycosyltransferase involved in cell wall biosynthesis